MSPELEKTWKIMLHALAGHFGNLGNFGELGYISLTQVDVSEGTRPNLPAQGEPASYPDVCPGHGW